MNNAQTYNYAKTFLGKGGATFRKYCGLPSGAAWCDAFVTYIFHHTGNTNLFCSGKKQTYCPTTIKILQKDMAQIPLYLAMPMDVLFFDWDRNGVPNHIGFVRAKKDTSSIYTIEGNTDGGKVAQKTRAGKYVQAVFRPHYKGNFKTAKLNVDGDFGYNSIAMLQKMLGCTVDGVLGIKTVKALQKWAGCSQDGAWGKATSKAVQKKIGVTADGEFGKKSVTALQKYINSKVFPSSNGGVASSPTVTKATYRIDVDLTNQICTIYKNGKAVMSEWVSTARKGHTTPTGNFKISGASGGRKAKYRTCLMASKKSYAEFACRFHGAKMMHTVPYKKRQTSGHVNKDNFNKLGTPASSGCVRMPWKMAHFIYTNCPVGTPVHVFKGTKGKYPMGKPTKYRATSNIDPTYKK